MNDPMTKLDCIPEDLRMPVTVSFATPQFGPHHNEGGFMLSHLSLMFDILEDVRRGEFHPNVPDDARAAIKAAVINLSDLLVQHILLHDMEKPNCMTFVYKGERKSAISADEWIAMLQDDQDGERILIGNDEAVADFCTNHHIVQISYYQETGNGKHAHGAVAAETLRKHGGFDDECDSDLLRAGLQLHRSDGFALR